MYSFDDLLTNRNLSICFERGCISQDFEGLVPKIERGAEIVVRSLFCSCGLRSRRYVLSISPRSHFASMKSKMNRDTRSRAIAQTKILGIEAGVFLRK